MTSLRGRLVSTLTWLHLDSKLCKQVVHHGAYAAARALSWALKKSGRLGLLACWKGCSCMNAPRGASWASGSGWRWGWGQREMLWCGAPSWLLALGATCPSNLHMRGRGIRAPGQLAPAVQVQGYCALASGLRMMHHLATVSLVARQARSVLPMRLPGRTPAIEEQREQRQDQHGRDKVQAVGERLVLVDVAAPPLCAVHNAKHISAPALAQACVILQAAGTAQCAAHASALLMEQAGWSCAAVIHSTLPGLASSARS